MAIFIGLPMGFCVLVQYFQYWVIKIKNIICVLKGAVIDWSWYLKRLFQAIKVYQSNVYPCIWYINDFIHFSFERAPISIVYKSLNVGIKIEYEVCLIKHLGLYIDYQKYVYIHLKQPYIINNIITSIQLISEANTNLTLSTKNLLTQYKGVTSKEKQFLL